MNTGEVNRVLWTYAAFDKFRESNSGGAIVEYITTLKVIALAKDAQELADVACEKLPLHVSAQRPTGKLFNEGRSPDAIAMSISQ